MNGLGSLFSGGFFRFRWACPSQHDGDNCHNASRDVERDIENLRVKLDKLKSGLKLSGYEKLLKIATELGEEEMKVDKTLNMLLAEANSLGVNIDSLGAWCKKAEKWKKDACDRLDKLKDERGRLSELVEVALKKSKTVKELQERIEATRAVIKIKRGKIVKVKKMLENLVEKAKSDNILIKNKQEKQKVNIQALKEKDNMILMGSLTVLGILLFVKKIKN